MTKVSSCHRAHTMRWVLIDEASGEAIEQQTTVLCTFCEKTCTAITEGEFEQRLEDYVQENTLQ